MTILKAYVSPILLLTIIMSRKQCLSAAVIFRHIIPVVILASLFLLTCNNIPDLVFAQNAITIGSNNITGTLSNQTAKIEPKLSVDAACQIGQPDIPGNFNASGFGQNAHIGIVFHKNSSLPTSFSEPFSLAHNDYTDALGEINGTFIIHPQVGNYREYFLHVFTDDDKDSLPDDPVEAASASLNIC